MKIKKNNKVKIIFLYYFIAFILLVIGITFSKYKMSAIAKTKINTSKFSFKVTDKIENVEINLADTLIPNLYTKSELVPR